MKVLVVNAYGPSNRGDAVLLEECLADIRSAAPDAQISGVVFEAAEVVQSLYPEVAWSERVGNASGRLGRLKSLAYMAVAWCSIKLAIPGLDRLLPHRQRQTLAALRACDIIVSAPGGYLHDTNFAYILALLHIALGTALGKPVVLAPQSIGPIRGPIGLAMARRVLSRCQHICVRESYSFDFVTRELGIAEARVVRTGDSAFWNDDVSGDAALVDAALAGIGVAANEPILGVTIVAWNFPGSADPALDNEAYVASVAAVLDLVSERHGLTPVIFNQVSHDLPTVRAVQSRARRRVLVDDTPHPPALLRAMIARSTLFLGTRFHSCIFAMMAGVPTVAVAYLPKTQFIMRDLDLADRCTPIEAVDTEAVLGQFARDFADLSEARAVIENAVLAYRARFARLRDVLVSATSGATGANP